MKRCPLLLFLVVLAAACASPVAAAPLRDGERFVYRVGWGVFGHAGTITIAAEEETLAGLPQTRVVTRTATRGLVRALFPFEGRVESVFDLRTGRLLAAEATTSARRKQTKASIVFDYAAGRARYVDCLRPQRSTTLPIPPGAPMDLITSLINTRGWDLEPGEARPLVVLFDDEFYELVITAERIETIETARGERRALLLVPRMEGAPKGMFRRGGSVRVWLSEAEPRLPLRLEVAVQVGTATAVLTEYRPPGADVAAHAHPRP